ncbi:polyprenyl synthetase family protein [Pleionea sediminis]|uniref:polyprenyl synthetase family protein n=1 Tax=Pleionea sediminis TaxID=2569479 RepID=UPI0011868617|nr:polyprenyl synthetase family protein [Pleionea sediminis]
MESNANPAEAKPIPLSRSDLYISPQCYYIAEQNSLEYLLKILKVASTDCTFDDLLVEFTQWNEAKNRQGNRFFQGRVSEVNEWELDVESWSFIQRLQADKQLNTYLDKSVSYLLMRDLGISFHDDQATKDKNRLVRRLQRWLIQQSSKSSEQNSAFSMVNLSKKAKEYGIGSTFNWLLNKLSGAQANMPDNLDSTEGMRKLVKIIAGVVLHQMVDLPKSVSEQQRAKLLDSAIRLGYCYGLTYPFIDDLLDDNYVLSERDKRVFNDAINRSLLTGHVVECPTFDSTVQSQMQFIYRELREAFETIRHLQPAEQSQQFFEQAYIFFKAQDIDRTRSLANSKSLDIKSLFLPLILKSAGCRLIARHILAKSSDESFDHRTFCFGIYNQFNDDIKDIDDDLKNDNVTPYTHYLTYGVNDKNSVNPYRVYWSVVFYLINNLYKGHQQSKYLILERSINAHRSVLRAVGKERYNDLREKLLHTGHKEFDEKLHSIVMMSSNVAWFDKFLSRQVAQFFEQQQNRKERFQLQFEQAKQIVESAIPIKPVSKQLPHQLVTAANYSLTNGGKRLRSIIAYKLSTDMYQLHEAQWKPIVQLLEYMHTSSLIFDDKPTQDNADLRRGKPTLHKRYQCEATAELTAVSLMMKAVEVQSQIRGVDSKIVLKAIEYSAKTTQRICEGQLLDLQAGSNNFDLETLETICHLKTGLAIEASLMIPAIIADDDELAQKKLCQFAYHLGIAFQVKDDLLDVTGNEANLGKPVKQDKNLGKQNFVSLLGENGAVDKMYHHYFKAQKYLESFDSVSDFLMQILDFAIFREQ